MLMVRTVVLTVLLLLAPGHGAVAQTPVPVDQAQAKAALVADIVKTASEVFRTATDGKKEPAIIQAGVTVSVSYVIRQALAHGADRQTAGEAVRTVRTDTSLHLDPLIIKSLRAVQADYPVMPTMPTMPVPATPAAP
jgi:hypothetical protein